MERRCWIPVIAILSFGLVLWGCSADDRAARPDAAVVEPSAPVNDEPPAAGAVGSRPQKGPWWRDPEVVTALDLSDDQVERVGQLMAGDPNRRATERRRERHAGLSFLRALSQDPYDRALVERRSAELTEILAENQRHRVANVRALRDILTYAQWMKLWEVAPQAIQVGRFYATLGPKITVSDGTQMTVDDDEVGAEDPEPAP